MRVQKCYCDFCKEEIKSSEFFVNFSGVKVHYNNNGKIENTDETSKNKQLEGSIEELLKFCQRDFHIDCLNNFLSKINFDLDLDEPMESNDNKDTEEEEKEELLSEKKNSFLEDKIDKDDIKEYSKKEASNETEVNPIKEEHIEPEEEDNLSNEEKIKRYENSLKASVKKVDVGKLIALRNARWSSESIANELGISKPYVFKILQRLKELGDTRLK